MELFTHLWAGMQNLIGIKPVLVVAAGVVVGILGGAMPGVSPSMAVAILLPFTFGMSPTMGMVMLCAIYLASNYGGSITAVMINTPGTPSAVVTAFDGYPMTRKGKGGVAITVATVASFWGGIISTIALLLVLAILSGVLLVMSFFGREAGKPTWVKAPGHFFATAVLTILMVMSLKYVGFYVASAVYMLVLALLLGLRRPLLLIVCTVLLLAIVYGVFVRFLSVPVPLGVFEEFTFSDIAGSLAKAKAAWALL